jgi:aminoglycoside phosphotransferase (APT) family kinase protein
MAIMGNESTSLGTFGLDEQAVDFWLRENVPTLRPPSAFRLISGGQSNLTFLGTDAAGTEFVLRRPPVGELLESAHDMSREYRIIKALGPTPVPVPETLGRCDDPGVTGSAFYLMAFVDGLVIRDAADCERHLTAPARAVVGESMIDTLADLHSLTPSQVGLENLSRHEGYVARQLRRWSGQWQASADQELPAIKSSYELLSERIPNQHRTSVVHGDFRMDNVVLTPAGRVASVLDWELCTLGDPLADVGMLLLNWVDPGESTQHLLSGTPTAAGGFASRDEIVARYASRAEVDVSDVPYFVAFNLWKLACIAEGIRARLQSGAMGDALEQHDEDLRRKITALAEASLEMLESR